MLTTLKNNLSMSIAVLFTLLCMIISLYTPLDDSLIAGGMTVIWLLTFSISEYYLRKHQKDQHDS